MPQPLLYIIAGCNGAGKTTASMTILPELFACRQFVNADEIARGLSPLDPDTVAVQAGKIMLNRIDELLKQGATFALETTLATRSYAGLIQRAQRLGYRVSLHFFWLPSVEQANQRVALRVSQGGHDIPSEVIARRYYRGLENLFDIFLPIVDDWAVYDNTFGEIKPIASNIQILDFETFKLIKEYGKH